MTKAVVKEIPAKIANSIELIGDVVSAEVKLNKMEIFEKGVEIVEETLKELFALRQSDEQKFSRLMLATAKEYGEEVIVPSENFNTIVNQIFRIYAAAVESQSHPNIHIAGYKLWNCLRLCLEDAGLSENDKFVNQFQRQVLSTTYHEINPSVKEKLAESFPRFYNSCTNIIRDCPLSQLRAVNSILFHFVASQPHNEKLLDEIIHWLPNGVFANHNFDELWKYKSNENDMEWHNLNNSSVTIFSHEMLKKWQFYLEDFSGKYNIAPEDKENLLRDASDSYKYNSLQETFFKLECFYLSQGKYDVIKKLWHINETDGSGVIMISDPIRPTAIDRLLLFYSFYLEKEVFHETMYFNEPFKHVGWTKEYFVILLLKTLQYRDTSIGRLSCFETYMLRNLLDIRHSLGDVINRLKGKKDLLKVLFFDSNNDIPSKINNKNDPESPTVEQNNNKEEKLFEKLEYFLFETLNKACRAEIQKREIASPLSATKITEYKDKFWEGYSSSERIAAFLKVDDGLKPPSDDSVPFFGSNLFFPRDLFLDDTNIAFSSLDIGWQFLLDENSAIYSDIGALCQNQPKELFIELLKKFEKPLIFTTFNGAYDFIEKLKEARRDFSSGDFYLEMEKKIPVNFIKMKTDDRTKPDFPCLLLLDENHLGTVVQYSPIEDAQKDTVFRNFVLNITDGQELYKTNEPLSEKPSWYLNIADTEEKRKDYLMERVLIKTVERFQFVPAPDFVGYAFYKEESLPVEASETT
jgi:hypothetical protein